MTRNCDADLCQAVAPLLPNDADLESVLGQDTLQRMNACWQDLLKLGFTVNIGMDSVRVRHEDSNYETVIHLSREGDLGELRNLFVSLRRRFGRVRDRWLPWLFLPGPAVSTPYNHLREIILVCQQLRQARGCTSRKGS